MSSTELKNIADKLPGLAAELTRVQGLFSDQDVGEFLSLSKLCEIGDAGEPQVESICAELICAGYLKERLQAFCPDCDAKVEKVGPKYSCDLCDKLFSPKVAVYEKGYSIAKALPPARHWSEDFRTLDAFPPFQVAVLRTIPRFCYAIQKNPPSFLKTTRETGKAKEADFRDEMERVLQLQYELAAEAQHTHGRTDLIVRPSDGGLTGLIGEFKVWGRNDYKKVVGQLLSYLTDFQDCGFIFMVNENKARIGDAYKRDIVLRDSTLVPGSLSESPILNEANTFDHFMSCHEPFGRRVKIFHFIFNVFC